MFSTGVYFKVWNVVNKGNYSEVECSTSKKNKQTGNYETDFSSKFVRFVGAAHQKSPQKDERIKITNCGVENVYVKDGENVYLKSPRYIVFDFERDNSNGLPNSAYVPSAYGGNPSPFEPIPIADEGDLPF